MSELRHILVICLDNIGDLVCTLPLIRALFEYFPRAWIGVLANSYNRDVLMGNPDLKRWPPTPKPSIAKMINP